MFYTVITLSCGAFGSQIIDERHFGSVCEARGYASTRDGLVLIVPLQVTDIIVMGA